MITLPEEDLNARRSGHINKEGWLIQYCFGKDKTGKYMDYYATNRWYGDSHVRIYADGTEKEFPVLLDFHLTSDDSVEDKRLENEFYERNRKVAKMLIEKGFDRFTINMALSVWPVKDSKKE
ncbi:MAG: hypothetical protein PQ964_06605 [Methanobacteriaceae archaeon]